MRLSRIGYIGLAAAAIGMLAPTFTPPAIHAQMTTTKKRRREVAPISIYRESRLNRSRKWAYAETYADARRISPFPNRPVR